MKKLKLLSIKSPNKAAHTARFAGWTCCCAARLWRQRYEPMKLFALIMLLFAFNAYAVEYPSCDVHASKNVALYTDGTKAKIEATVKGAPCYEAQLEIKVIVSGKVAYSYKAPFKPHVAINWATLTEKDVNEFIERMYANYNLIKCSELLPSNFTEDDPSGFSFNSLLVPVPEYEKYKSSNCKVFIHQIQYETNRAIVFPVGSKKGVAVSEFGS